MTELEVLRLERDSARAHVALLVKILVGINQLTYPPVTRLPDGRVFHFRAPDCHVFMQELSDRIRAIPDEIKAAEAAAGEAPSLPFDGPTFSRFNKETP